MNSNATKNCDVDRIIGLKDSNAALKFMTDIVSVVQKLYDPTYTKEDEGIQTQITYKVFNIKSTYSQIDSSESSDTVKQ